MSAATFFMLLFFGIVLFAAWRTFKDDPPEPMPNANANKSPCAKPICSLAADKPEPGPVGVNMGAKITDEVVNIMENDRCFAPQGFLEDAVSSFKKILEAFEAGKLENVADLMSAKILGHLKDARKAAVKSGKFPKTEIIRVKRASIKDTRVLGKHADIDVLFETEQTAVMVDKGGKVIEGDENQILFISDLWTFSRDLKSRDNWILSAIKAEEAK